MEGDAESGELELREVKKVLFDLVGKDDKGEGNARHVRHRNVERERGKSGVKQKSGTRQPSRTRSKDSSLAAAMSAF